MRFTLRDPESLDDLLGHRSSLRNSLHLRSGGCFLLRASIGHRCECDRSTGRPLLPADCALLSGADRNDKRPPLRKPGGAVVVRRAAFAVELACEVDLDVARRHVVAIIGGGGGVLATTPIALEVHPVAGCARALARVVDRVHEPVPNLERTGCSCWR